MKWLYAFTAFVAILLAPRPAYPELVYDAMEEVPATSETTQMEEVSAAKELPTTKTLEQLEYEDFSRRLEERDRERREQRAILDAEESDGGVSE